MIPFEYLPVQGGRSEVRVGEQPRASYVETIENLVHLLPIELFRSQQDGAKVFDRYLAALRDVRLKNNEHQQRKKKLQETPKIRQGSKTIRKAKMIQNLAYKNKENQQQNEKRKKESKTLKKENRFRTTTEKQHRTALANNIITV